MDEQTDKKKAHRKRQAGPKAAKKKGKQVIDQNLTPQQRNPKAFSIQHANKTLRTVQRTQDIKTKKQHIPLVDRTPLEPPPIIVGVVGPPKVGKTTLLKCVVKNFTKQRLTRIQGPVTVVSGKQRRLTIIECNNDISAMIDIAKVADLVLMLVDASFGFEMETFEFLNICQVHGFPRIMGVLTHLDSFKDSKKLRKTKKRLKHRFWTEVYQGAKLFYLSGMVNGEYQKTEVHNLCRFISVMKFRPLTWRTTHPYILADRMEDLTDLEKVRLFSKTDRDVSLYGYLHGTHMKNNISVHIPGCGDFSIHDIQFLTDPCPTPEKQKKRSLSQRDRVVYAPMSGVGGIVYDKDAVYIDLGGSHSHKQAQDEDASQPVNELVSSLMAMNNPLDKKMTTSQVTLYSEGIKSSEVTQDDDYSGDREFETVQSGDRMRRRAVFTDDGHQMAAEDDSGRESDEDYDVDDDENENAITKKSMLDMVDSDGEISFKSKPGELKKTSNKQVDMEESSDDDEITLKSSKNIDKKSHKTVESDESDDDDDNDDDEEEEECETESPRGKTKKQKRAESDVIDSDDDEDDDDYDDDEEEESETESPQGKTKKQKSAKSDVIDSDDDYDDDDDSSEDDSDDLLEIQKDKKSSKKQLPDKNVKDNKKNAKLRQEMHKQKPSLTEVSKSKRHVDGAGETKLNLTSKQGNKNKPNVNSSESESSSESDSEEDVKTAKSKDLKLSKQKTESSDLNLSQQQMKTVMKLTEDNFSDSASESDSEHETEQKKKKKVVQDKKKSESVLVDSDKNKKNKEKDNKKSESVVVGNDKKSIKSLSEKLVSLSQTDYYSWKLDEKTPAAASSVSKSKERDMEAEESDDDDEEDEIGSDKEEDDDEEESFKWKHDLAAQAAANFRERQLGRVNYRKFIYGKEEQSNEEKDKENDDDDEIGGLFKVLKEKSEASAHDRVSINSTDCSKPQKYTITQLDIDKIQELIADCFVTGKWDESKDAEALLEKDDELYGDFEDLETGETHAADTKKEDDDSEEGEDEAGASGMEDESEKPPEEVKKKKSEMTSEEKRAEKKRKLKEMFDTQYDMKGDTEFYDNWKEELDQQAKMNRSVFEDMDDDLRVQYEGFRPGMYVRVEIHGVPCEFVTNFDPTYPLILGGLLSVENNVGFVQTRLKKHRWHKKILKTKNPLIISLGWRRFQSIPLYSVQDHNMRNRLLKYTPEHLHCHACFWGPITPQGTGLLAVENIANVSPDFRIAATGVVLELDKSLQIVKKLKLTGTPQKIYSKTAFIQGMFNSSLEVAKFEGASLRTVSGVRGQIKKAAKTPEGAFRATFEDKILLSDIVFLRTWYPVEVPQFYNPVTTMLLPPSQKQTWTGLKTYGDLYREKKLKPTFSEDSRYKKIERKGKSYAPLSIPKALQRVLPFKDTPKSLIEKKDTVKRVAVIREPHEAKISKMVSMLKNVYEHKRRTEHAQMRQRAAQHQKQVQKIDREKQKKHREIKKQVFRMLGKMEQRKNAHKNKD